MSSPVGCTKIDVMDTLSGDHTSASKTDTLEGPFRFNPLVLPANRAARTTSMPAQVVGDKRKAKVGLKFIVVGGSIGGWYSLGWCI